ncbi:TOBE domain-containing protein [Pseudidiomarina sediminum]|uniref:TOBE domain-containing protein n=1 Tax=Pseudidiomarina sediminum TaxID=431675 RepID=UPI001C9759E4|nr:TOBE domain-containing protein [Pseudidiomarina sediminum]MBY6062839.1 TOBE domain-containing protein [Pseudidiomarina sediminum]
MVLFQGKGQGQRDFTNGEQGTITQVLQQGDDIRFTVKLDSGRTVSFYQSDYSDEQGRLQLVQAYACTVYSSQGATINGDTFLCCIPRPWTERLRTWLEA